MWEDLKVLESFGGTELDVYNIKNDLQKTE
jgi:hypothetical protein